jgi:hypothetical protein
LPNLSLGSFAPVGVGFTGCVKIGIPSVANDCCDCAGSREGSIIAVYDSGSPITLWICQGCICQQIPLTSEVSLQDGYPISLHPGGVSTDDCCGSCCYALTSDPETNTGELADDYAGAQSIKGLVIDNIANGILLGYAQDDLARSQKREAATVAALAATEAALEKCNHPDSSGGGEGGDPFAEMLLEFAGC